MPRFVLLRHECPPGLGKPSHWDLMLEDDGELLTWSLDALPVARGERVSAARLPNHRIAYLDYEGPISGGRGDVHRTDDGEFQWIERTVSLCRVQLIGSMLQGELAIEELEAGQLRLTLQG
jgi:hypothetical protein